MVFVPGNTKHTLRRAFFGQQLLLLVFGLIFALALTIFVRRIQTHAADARLRAEIRSSVERSAENLRAWQMLGMFEAINTEIRKLEMELPITKIEFLGKKDFSARRSNSIRVPDVDDPDLDIYISVDYKSPVDTFGTLKDPSIYVTLISVLLLVVANIFLGIRFFSRNVYLPLVNLKESLRGRRFDPSTLGHGEIWDTIRDISTIMHENDDLHRQRQQLEKQAILGEFAAQVSHDIRSPLSALSLIVGSLKELPEEKRVLIREATKRINDIANELLGRQKNSARELKNLSEPSMIAATVDLVLSEKRVQIRRQHSRIKIDGDLTKSYGLFSIINTVELSRALSNIINNAVEAIVEFGQINVSVFRTSENGKSFVTINISDTGAGIAPEILSRIGVRGFSHGKASATSGSGLGLSHAILTMQEAGGRLDIRSEPGMGTCIQMHLPLAAAPAWFFQDLNVSEGQIVVSVDDDESIHRIWAKKFADQAVQLVKLYSPDELVDWVRLSTSKNAIFLVDYEFIDRARSGLDVIGELELGAQAALVTSRYDDPAIRKKSLTLGVRILPKVLAPFIPINKSTRPSALTFSHSP